MVTVTRPRPTQVEAFYRGIERGTFKSRRAQVYVGLRDLGISTANEVFEYLKESRHFKLRYDSNTRARLTELRDLGYIREVGKRACRITGQMCITWEVIPASEYAGVALEVRCPTCNQIVERVVPVARRPIR
jgi:hypothetical protein